MNVLKKVNDLLSKAIIAVISTGMAAVTLIVCLQVFYRYILGHSLAWAEELTLYIEVYVVFLAAGFALGTGQHICMDLVVSKVPHTVAVIMNKVTSLICAVYAVAMTYFCYTFTVAETGQKMATLPGYKWMVYMAMVIGSALMVFYALTLLFRKAELVPAAETDPNVKEGE